MKKAFAYTGNETVGAAMAQRLEAAGYVRTDDPVEAGVIITYCTSQTALEDAYFDEEGYMQTAAPGALLLDLSPTTPDFARELNAVAVVSSLVLVEAPLVVLDVARPEAFADRDNLACFVAGDEDGVEAAAFTVLEPGDTAPMPPELEIHFTLDRPFLFSVVTGDGLPLFAGIVNTP